MTLSQALLFVRVHLTGGAALLIRWGEREEFAMTRPLSRYATVAGIPAEMLERPGGRAVAPWRTDRTAGSEAIVAATVALATAVLEDRRQIFSCAGWVDSAHGLPGAFVSVPMPVGARGAEEPLPLRLTLEEKALLQRAAHTP